MGDTDKQIELAQELAAELVTAGHDEMEAVDLLECLATAGLVLVPMGDENVASAAYFALAERTRRLSHRPDPSP
jgi:hypothetical protein